MTMQRLAKLMCLFALAAYSVGCGEFKVPLAWVLPNKAGDNPPNNPPDDNDDGGETPDDGSGGGGDDGGDDGDDGGGGSGGGGQVDTRFSGTWIAAYGDDLPAGLGRRQHVVQLTLSQSNATVTGSGQMARFYNTGPVAFDTNPFLLDVNGTVSGSDATLNLSAVSGSPFTFNPQWIVRYGGNTLVGVFAEKDPNNGSLANGGRMGGAQWHRVTSLNPTGDWVASYADAFGGGAFQPRDRTAQLSLTRNPDSTVTGLGSFVEFGTAGGPFPFSFDLVDGGSQLRQVRFTLGNFQPLDGTEDWYTLQTGDVLVGGYSRFNDNDAAVRSGHATWRRSGAVQSNDYVREWVTAFGDTQPTGDDGSDFLIAFESIVLNGNAVTGSARVWDESESSPAFRSFTIENGTVVGTNLVLDLVFGNRRFSWDMRIANGTLAGSYRRTGINDSFQGRGHAEWGFGSRSNLAGTWAASFFDTYSANLDANQVDDRASQLAVMTISSVDGNGAVSGTGFLRLANETTRRNFTITGQVVAEGVEIVWSGADLFGQTLWQTQKAGSRLFGTYTNLNDQNGVEQQGHATFLRMN
ncbi:MAG: hypothetical protein AMXMBFR84_00490 [Candidatus Hydrogenedentota bacterium]